MIVKKLHSGWQMRMVGEEELRSAVVPGSVYQDLLRDGGMEDPYYRDNELRALAVMDHDFEYVLQFSVPEEMWDQAEILLRFDGIDTVADLELNHTPLGHVENMHRTWEFPVKGLLRPGNNLLRVTLRSPTQFIRKANERATLKGTTDAMEGFPHLRKAHCMFGWDWGPRLPDAGIWRDVSLLAYSTARLDSVYITQEHLGDAVTLRFQVQAELPDCAELLDLDGDRARAAGLRCRVTVTDPDSCRVESSSDQVFASGLSIQNPKLWWPNGYGAQPLYQVRVDLLSGEQVIDRWERRIGLRTMTVCRDPDQWGEQFCHMVNGVKIFAMGADYIPEDCLLGRVTPERTRRLLEQARDANYNCIRVWGGGHYPSDAFYDACDELGLVVWQDFMFACAVYDLTEDFEANITAEAIDNIKRIRHHASLGLWCGNNEMEMFVDYGVWVDRPSQKSDYVKMYEYLLPKLCRRYDPNTFYWPASPSSGGAFDKPNDENRGDAHYWDVWHGNKPFTEYRKFHFRYVSEFGFQSFPALKTCESFTLPEDRNIFSYVMEKHQRNATANGKIMNYLEQTFLYPSDFDTTLYASQLLQAEAIRYGIEHFRRNRGRCMGAIVWQLNDCWPVASWSSIDYYGRWKALHYYEKRCFAPILLSCEEEGILTQDPNPNAQPYKVRKSIRLNVANETRQDIQVTVRWTLRRADGSVKRGGEQVVSVPALSARWLEREDLDDADLYRDYVSFACLRSGETISQGSVLFCPHKQFHYQDPCLSVRVEGNEVVVSSQAFAKAVEIRNENEDLLLEDNYFDLNGGERRVKILRGSTSGLKVRSVYSIR